MADMNGLKQVNDTYGHEEGDGLIIAGATLLRNQHVDGAVYEKNFRTGGDEFVKIAVGEFTPACVDQFIKGLYASAAAYSEGSGKPYPVEMSVGCCFGKAANMEQMEALLSRADQRMYEEKKRLKGKR